MIQCGNSSRGDYALLRPRVLLGKLERALCALDPSVNFSWYTSFIHIIVVRTANLRGSVRLSTTCRFKCAGVLFGGSFSNFVKDEIID